MSHRLALVLLGQTLSRSQVHSGNEGQYVRMVTEQVGQFQLTSPHRALQPYPQHPEGRSSKHSGKGTVEDQGVVELVHVLKVFFVLLVEVRGHRSA